MVVSEHIFERYKTFAADSIIRVDPARIAAQVVTGIGFLGAGTIMRLKTTVRGLTTAASLWVVAGIGLAIGSSCYIPAILTTILALIALLLVPFFERNVKRDKYKTIKLCISGAEPLFTPILAILERNSMDMQQYEYERDIVKNEVVYSISVRFKDESSIIKVSDEITTSIKEIRKLGWE
jgi:putative Mg2+ transporter-C (MgtC) family protein